MNSAPAAPWRVLSVLAVTTMLCHFNRSGMAVAGTEFILRHRDVSETRMGLIYDAYLIVYTICMIPGGWLITARGPRVALMVMGFGSVFFVFLTALTLKFAVAGGVLFASLLVVRGLMGSVTAPVHPGAARMVQLRIPLTGRSRGNGFVTFSALVGIAASTPGMGWISDRIGWPGAFGVAGLITAVVSAGWFLIDPDDLQAAKVLSAPREPLRLGALVRNRSLLLLTLSYGAVSYFQYLFFYWMQYYFVKILLLRDEDARFYTMMASIAIGAGMLGGGWLYDSVERRLGQRRGRLGVTTASLSLAALFVGFGIAGTEANWVVVCFCLAMGSLGICEAAYWTTATQVGGARGGMAAALMNTGGNAGGLLAPVVTPLFAHYFGWKSGLAIACGVSVVGALCWFGIDPEERERT